MSSSEVVEIKKNIIRSCQKMNELGVNQGMSGNISVRNDTEMLISPTSMSYDSLEQEDIVSLSLHSGKAKGRRSPSSEWRFHRDIMRARPDVQAVVHAHPIYATTISIMEREIPAVHYMIAVAGGDNIRCAPYATYGTDALSRYAVEALVDRKACLLAHHGVIVVGESLSKAMWLLVEVETLARQYHGCLQFGEPPCLSSQEVKDVISQMRGGYAHSQ